MHSLLCYCFLSPLLWDVFGLEKTVFCFAVVRPLIVFTATSANSTSVLNRVTMVLVGCLGVVKEKLANGNKSVKSWKHLLKLIQWNLVEGSAKVVVMCPFLYSRCGWEVWFSSLCLWYSFCIGRWTRCALNNCTLASCTMLFDGRVGQCLVVCYLSNNCALFETHFEFPSRYVCSPSAMSPILPVFSLQAC